MTNKHKQKDAYKIGFSATNTARQNSDYNKNKNTSRTCKNYEISETDQYTATIDWQEINENDLFSSLNSLYYNKQASKVKQNENQPSMNNHKQNDSNLLKYSNRYVKRRMTEITCEDLDQKNVLQDHVKMYLNTPLSMKWRELQRSASYNRNEKIQ